VSAPETHKGVDTSRMWDIARYVEKHPDDHAQRWRLVKKLYAAWEYKLALEHLRVLKAKWHRKINVIRYLAATYYRLGRCEEAVRELQEAIVFWPQDLGLREQLARILEFAGKYEAAAAVWNGIKSLKEDHPLADSAIRRLAEDKTNGELRKPPVIGDSDNGIELTPGQVCEQCGAQNSHDFDKCWQCQAQLSETSTDAPSTQPRGQSTLGMAPETFTLTLGLVVVGLLVVCAYAGLRLLLAWHGSQADPVVPGLADLFAEDLGRSRAAAGFALVFLWPFAILFAFRLFPPRRTVRGPHVTLSGLLLGSVAFLSSWLQWPAIWFAPVLPALLALGVAIWVFRLSLGRALGVWAVQLACMLGAAWGAFALSEYLETGILFHPVRDLPALHAVERGSPAMPRGASGFSFSRGVVPFRVSDVSWHGTGSPWLDHRAGMVRFSVTTPRPDAGLKFEVQDHTGTRVYEDIRGADWSRVFRVEPGRNYVLLIIGEEGVPVNLSFRGFLRPNLASSHFEAAAP